MRGVPASTSLLPSSLLDERSCFADLPLELRAMACGLTVDTRAGAVQLHLNLAQVTLSRLQTRVERVGIHEAAAVYGDIDRRRVGHLRGAGLCSRGDPETMF